MPPMIQRWNGLAPTDTANHDAESRTAGWGIPGYHYVIASNSNASSNCPVEKATSNCRRSASNQVHDTHLLLRVMCESFIDRMRVGIARRLGREFPQFMSTDAHL